MQPCLGLNPYGLTYTLGLQGMGTPRANPAPIGLDGFERIAAGIGARTVEFDLRWLAPLPDDSIVALAERVRQRGAVVVVSTWLSHQPGETLDEARRIARLMGRALIRMHLIPVLEGARAAQGDAWNRMVEHARSVLFKEAAKSRDEGLRIGLENHQELGSEELLAIAGEAGDNVGIVLDTGNPFAVGEDPVAFAARVAGRVVHMHLKDYRAQFTGEGVRLVRCAIGEGCVPFVEIAEALGTSAEPITASLEPAALDARHIRLFTDEWWNGYPARSARELGVALGRLRHRALNHDEDFRTPWERDAPPDEIVAYERQHLAQSVAWARGMGWMPRLED